MGINIYNDNEEKFSETLKSLKELPKVSAPDDFEFNLMIKINNGEFAPEAEEKRQSKLLWILTPAALVVTTLILFITFSKSELDQQLNPLQNQGSIYAGKVGDSVSKPKPLPTMAENQSSRKKVQTRTPDPVQVQEFFPDPNMFVKDYSLSPLSKEGSFNLDNLIQGKQQNRNQNVLTVNSGNSIPDEFLLQAQNPKNTLKEKKAVQDSLKKMTSRNDSLNIKKNIKR